MKTIQLRVSDEEHTTIKVEAAKRGLSIKDYVMARVEQFAPDTPLKSFDKLSPQDKLDAMKPEQVPKDWQRFQKKGKK